jgi:hypothetical protein
MENIVTTLLYVGAVVVALALIAAAWEFGRRAWYWSAARIMGWDEREKFIRETAWIDRAGKREQRKQQLDEALSANYDRRRAGSLLVTAAFAFVGYNIDWPWWHALPAVALLWTGLHMLAGISMRWWY